MNTCDDLRLGGTLSSSGISGGVSINSTGISVADWSTLFGTVGYSGSLIGVYGRPGVVVAGDNLPRERLLTLMVNVHRRDPVDCTPSDLALLANTDLFLELASQREGAYLEVDLPDTTSRFLHVRNLDPGPITQPAAFRSAQIPFVAEWGFWRAGGTERSGGAPTVTINGSQTVYDAVLSFPSAGVFAHTGLGWSIEALAGSFPLVVDLGRRTVEVGGVAVSNRIRRTTVTGQGRVWGWFTKGANSVTGAATVTWRDQWL